MSENESSDGRQAGGFTDEEAQIHKAGFKIIFDGLQEGLGFDDACSGLQVVNPQMRNVIIDDYLKVTIAEQHFQGKKPLEDVAAELKLPVDRVEGKKNEMLGEVQRAAAAHFKKKAGGPIFGDQPEGGEATKKKGH